MRRLALALVFALGACGGGDSTGDGGIDGFDGFTARIDGELWKPSAAFSAVNNVPGRYFINAARTTGSNNYTIAITLLNIPGPGTYPLGVESSMFGGLAVVSHPGSGDWETPSSGAAGEFVITTLTATRMVGTFEFVAEGAGTRTVTEGEFDIPVTQTGGLAAANMGSSFTASVGGAFDVFNVAPVLTPGANPFLMIVAYSPAGQITISLSNMTGTSVYATSTSVPVRTIQLGQTSGGWGTQGTGGSGTVNLTVTADRFSGTFTATVVPTGGGATGTRTISGSFSIGRAP